LLVPLKLAADLKPGPIELKAKVSWLECKEVCVPGKADVSATLTIGDTAKPSTDAPAIVSWKEKVPRTNTIPSPDNGKAHQRQHPSTHHRIRTR